MLFKRINFDYLFCDWIFCLWYAFKNEPSLCSNQPVSLLRSSNHVDLQRNARETNDYSPYFSYTWTVSLLCEYRTCHQKNTLGGIANRIGAEITEENKKRSAQAANVLA